VGLVVVVSWFAPGDDSSLERNRQAPVVRPDPSVYDCDRPFGDVANDRILDAGRLDMTLFFTFLIYWLVAFVGCFVMVEIAQDQLYDQLTPHAGLKVTASAVILALLMMYFHPSFESMFMTNILNTVFQGIVWFAVFMFVLQFHPWHALGLGVATMLLVSGLATMGVDAMLNPKPQVASRPAAAVSTPVRSSLTPPKAAPAKSK